MKARRFVPLVLALGAASCAGPAERRRDEAASLERLIRSHCKGYLGAIESEKKAVAAVAAVLPAVGPRDGEAVLERQRQKILAHKHNYKYLHDELGRLRVASPECAALRDRAAAHLKRREKALLAFTTLLKSGSDGYAAGRPVDIGELAAAVQIHVFTADELGAVLAELRPLSAPR